MLDKDESFETVEALFCKWEKMLLSDDRAWEDVDECVEADQCCW
jgi:hypothetical protein